LWEESTRKPIPMRVKRAVYKRAKGKCEKCHIKLKIEIGDFHHTRDPTVTPRAKSVIFLCLLCHRRYGHRRVTRKHETLIGTEYETKVIRERVVRKPKRKTKRVAIRGLLGNVIGYRTIKIRKKKRKVKQKKKAVNRKKKRIKKRRR